MPHTSRLFKIILNFLMALLLKDLFVNKTNLTRQVFKALLSLYAPTPQNGQKYSNNSSIIIQKPVH